MPDVLGKMYSDPRSTGDWGNRPDGTPKGEGWLGILKRPGGGVSTEISVGVEIDGQEVQIPLLVPTLDAAEVRALLDAEPQSPDFFQKIPPSVLRKAIAFATERMRQQRSPFAGGWQ